MLPQAQYNHHLHRWWDRGTTGPAYTSSSSLAGQTYPSSADQLLHWWDDDMPRPSRIFFSSMAPWGALPPYSWQNLAHRGAFALTCWPLDPLAQGSSSAGWATRRTIPGCNKGGDQGTGRMSLLNLAQQRQQLQRTYLSCSWRPGSNRSGGWP